MVDTSALSANEVIDLLGLSPLAGEGGFFRETWKMPGIDSGPDPHGTAILYLITPDSWSALHRLKYDEVFHFYLGDPCRMVLAHEPDRFESVVLGQDISAGQRVQQVVPARWWQGTQLARGGRWALLGTTMAPGFHPDIFELASPGALEAFTPDVRQHLDAYLP
jgi:predicted cupin superfamily sugar epimerase